MKNKIVLAIFLMLLIPQVTFAAWWNPFTWKVFKFFQKQEPVVEQVVEIEGTQNATTTDSQTSEIEQLRKEIEELKKSQSSKSSGSSQPVKQTAPKPVTPTPTPTVPVASTPKLDPQLCAAIYDEEKILNKYLSESIGYFQRDLIPIFDAQVKTADYTQEYDNLSKTRDSFFKAVNEFKNKDIARINSDYLDQNYIKEFKDTLTALADGYKEVWDLFLMNSVKLKNIDFYDSYDKNRGYELIEEQYDLKKEKDKLLLKSIELWELMAGKFKEVKSKNECR